MTALICDALIQPFDTVPSQADDLKPLIDAPLIRKLPVSLYEERKFPQFVELIKTSHDECGNILARHISCCLVNDIFKELLRKYDTLGNREFDRNPAPDFSRVGVLPIEMDLISEDQETT